MCSWLKVATETLQENVVASTPYGVVGARNTELEKDAYAGWAIIPRAGTGLRFVYTYYCRAPASVNLPRKLQPLKEAVFSGHLWRSVHGLALRLSRTVEPGGVVPGIAKVGAGAY